MKMANSADVESPEKQSHTHLLHLTIFAPRSPKPKQFEFPPTETVGAAAKLAAEKFGYTTGKPGLETLPKKDVLDNGKTLEQAGVKSGDELELVDTGGGV
jgi:hypothetical protein